MIFGTSIRLSRINNKSIKICHRRVPINHTKSYKYLGILINSTLNMSNHFTAALKKGSSRINLLNRIRYFIDSHTAATIYKSMVIPTLTYCPLVTSCVSHTLINRLEHLEQRARKIISIQNATEIPSIISIFRKRSCTFVFKCLTGDVCSNFTNYFECIKHNVQTRNNEMMLRLPRVRTVVGQKGFYFDGAKIFNELPCNIRKQKTLKKFKDEINLYFK